MAQRQDEITFQRAPIAMGVLSGDDRWARVNERLAELLGSAPDEIEGQPRAAITHPQDVAAEAEALGRVLGGRDDRVEYEARYRRAGGEVLRVRIAATLADDGGDPHLLVAVTDVTAWREAERTLALQHATSRILAEAASADEALQRVIAEICQQLGWRHGAYWSFDEALGEARAIITMYEGGRPGGGFERATRELALRRGSGLPGRVWERDAPVWISDVVEDGNFPRSGFARREGLHAGFAFPVRAGTRLLGAMEFFSDRIAEPDEWLLAATAGIGHQLGQYIERRRAADVARAAEARNATVIETALDCIVTIDASGTIVEWNPAAERVFGYARDEAIGRNMGELIVPPRLREAHRQGMVRYVTTGEAHILGRRLELPAMRADGTEFPSELTITRMPLPGPPVFTGFLRDLSDVKREEERRQVLLQASAMLGSTLDYERTLRHLTSVIVPALADWYAVDLSEPDGRIRRLQVAHRDERLTALVRDLGVRYPLDPEARRGVPHVVRSGESEILSHIDADWLAGVSRDEGHLALLRELRLSSYMIVPLRAREEIFGAITFVSAESGRHYDESDLRLAEDIARRAAAAIENARLHLDLLESRARLEAQTAELERKSAELEAGTEDLARTNEQLRQVVAELARQRESAERAREEAASANRAKSEFLATMSHELRTPLNAIVGYTQLLEEGVRGAMNEAQLSDLTRIRRSAHHLLGLISDILNFAKVEAGRLQFEVESVAVHPTLGAIGDLVAPQARDKGLTYEYIPGDPAVTVCADEERLQQILLNLLSNAIRFTPEGGRVTLSWDARGSDVVICVGDTGPGIPPNKLEAIFEPFVQVHRTYAGQTEGTGLGLAISRELARGMGGDLWAEPAPREGATLVCRLPRGPDLPQRDSSGASSSTGAPGGT